MKMARGLLVLFCISLFSVSAAWAANYRHLETKDGVEVMAELYPLGPNNQIVAYIKFVNNNSYRVDVNWTPFFACEGSGINSGYGANFSMEAEGSYEVTIWRLGACGNAALKSIRVEMFVKQPG